MDTVPYERNIFKRNVNQLINKEIINKHRIVGISYGKNVYSTSPTIHISETINFIGGLLFLLYCNCYISMTLKRNHPYCCTVNVQICAQFMQKVFEIKTMQLSHTLG